MSHLSRWLAVFMAFLATGCVKQPALPTAPLVQNVAVLMFDNESNNVDAADIMQRMVYLALKKSAYNPVDIKTINEKLTKAGIVDGGQLPLADPVKMGKDFGAQGLMYGNVESFNYTNIGFYLQRKVKIELKLVDATNGTTLWENAGTGSRPEVHLDKKKAKDAFVRGVAEQTLEKTLNFPLEMEAQLAVQNALRTLPGFNFCGFAEDEQSPNALKKATRDVLKNSLRKR